jgi:translation initiation factor IF-2
MGSWGGSGGRQGGLGGRLPPSLGAGLEGEPGSGCGFSLSAEPPTLPHPTSPPSSRASPQPWARALPGMRGARGCAAQRARPRAPRGSRDQGRQELDGHCPPLPRGAAHAPPLPPQEPGLGSLRAALTACPRRWLLPVALGRAASPPRPRALPASPPRPAARGPTDAGAAAGRDPAVGGGGRARGGGGGGGGAGRGGAGRGGDVAATRPKSSAGPVCHPTRPRGSRWAPGKGGGYLGIIFANPSSLSPRPGTQ